MASLDRAHRVLAEAEQLARKHHAQYDPSHDFLHVTRVRGLALSIARSLPGHPRVDLVVVHLASLFHDLLDKKYLPRDQPVPSAREHLGPFWSAFSQDEVADEQRRLVERVVENVSYSKEVKRIAEGGQAEWHLTCLELHWCARSSRHSDSRERNTDRSSVFRRMWTSTDALAPTDSVQDADKLDAMGAFGASASRERLVRPGATLPQLRPVQCTFSGRQRSRSLTSPGIMRCSAYSALTNRPLYLPPSPSPSSAPSADDAVPPQQQQDDSAIAHFHDKLFRLESMIKTPRGRELAQKRAETLRRFVDETEREWREAEEGLV